MEADVRGILQSPIPAYTGHHRGVAFQGHEAQIHLGGDVVFGKMVEGCLRPQKGEAHEVGQERAVRDCGRRLGDER